MPICAPKIKSYICQTKRASTIIWGMLWHRLLCWTYLPWTNSYGFLISRLREFRAECHLFLFRRPHHHYQPLARTMVVRRSIAHKRRRNCSKSVCDSKLLLSDISHVFKKNYTSYCAGITHILYIFVGSRACAANHYVIAEKCPYQ